MIHLVGLIIQIGAAVPTNDYFHLETFLRSILPSENQSATTEFAFINNWYKYHNIKLWKKNNIKAKYTRSIYISFTFWETGEELLHSWYFFSDHWKNLSYRLLFMFFNMKYKLGPTFLCDFLISFLRLISFLVLIFKHFYGSFVTYHGA